jgi:hypothetical protein
MMAVINTASANTELAPASRLVAPYITLETGRATFLLLANTSSRELRASSGLVTSQGGVHIEFYSKGCSRNDQVVELSAKDIDQINITSVYASVIGADSSKLGFADIDVRDGTVHTSSQTAPGIRTNALTGVTLVADSTNDYAFSYPMAASQGSQSSGAGQTIVTRNAGGTGAALAWFGRYEPFPSRVFLPVYYAEGADSQGATVTGFLALVSPADGNWHGYGTGATLAEAPGEALSVSNAVGAALIKTSTLAYDGCENNTSYTPSGHTIYGTLDTLFPGGGMLRSNWLSCSGSGGGFPRVDEVSSQPVGWMQITNSSTECKGATNGCGSSTTNAKTATRALVGTFFSNSVGGSPSKKMADTSRLWGDPTTRTTTTNDCRTSAAVTRTCEYTFNSVDSAP